MVLLWTASVMSTHNALTRRVARRHRAAVALRDLPHDNIEVIYSDGGIVTTRDLARLVEPRVGVLVRVRFRRLLNGMPNTVRWDGLNEAGEIVSGNLVVHAAVSDDQVVCWAELVTQAEGCATKEDHADNPRDRIDLPTLAVSTTRTAAPARAAATGTPREHLLRARLRRIERLARRMIEEARVNPQRPAFALVADLVRIAEEASNS